jgi:hypothetical protein
VIAILDVYSTFNNAYIIFEECDRDLAKRHRPMSEQQVLGYLKDLAELLSNF